MWRGCILWRHHVGGCTHPWRISIVRHGPMGSKVSLHRVLTVLLSLLVFHLITVNFKLSLGSVGD